MDLRQKIRVISDFPKEGISFKDVTTLLKDGEAYKESIDMMYDRVKHLDFDVIVGPEARGFIFAAPLSYKTGKGFVPIRKPGKLPADTFSYEYELEYGKDTLEVHRDAILPGQKVLIVDDLLATGGTVSAVADMIERMGAHVAGVAFLMELTFLEGRDKLGEREVISLIKY